VANKKTPSHVGNFCLCGLQKIPAQLLDSASVLSLWVGEHREVMRHFVSFIVLLSLVSYCCAFIGIHVPFSINSGESWINVTASFYDSYEKPCLLSSINHITSVLEAYGATCSTLYETTCFWNTIGYFNFTLDFDFSGECTRYIFGFSMELPDPVNPNSTTITEGDVGLHGNCTTSPCDYVIETESYGYLGICSQLTTGGQLKVAAANLAATMILPPQAGP
jgi:hypothetical protein